MQSRFAFCLMCLCVGRVAASSIPMWEYLTKQEKTAYLYSTFRNQVEEYCEFSETENCVEGLTKYGLGKLRDMSEGQLDEMDPYQRGASLMIWNALTRGHDTLKPETTTPKTTFAPDNSYGSEAAASARIDNVYRLPPPEGFVPSSTNSISREDDGVEEKISSGVPLYRHPAARNAEGPLVVRVHPDGRPVREDEDQNVVPQDEDLRQYLLAKVKLPDY